jgi:hypothetical protein
MTQTRFTESQLVKAIKQALKNVCGFFSTTKGMLGASARTRLTAPIVFLPFLAC